MLPTYAKTPNVVIIFALKDTRNIYFVPQSDARPPGIHLQINQQLPAAAQISSHISELFHIPVLQQNILPFCEPIVSESGEEFSLFLLSAALGENFSTETISFADFLRKLPKTRMRLAYLKAFQVLMGAHGEDIKVVENFDLSKLDD